MYAIEEFGTQRALLFLYSSSNSLLLGQPVLNLGLPNFLNASVVGRGLSERGDGLGNWKTGGGRDTDSGLLLGWPILNLGLPNFLDAGVVGSGLSERGDC